MKLTLRFTCTQCSLILETKKNMAKKVYGSDRLQIHLFSIQTPDEGSGPVDGPAAVSPGEKNRRYKLSRGWVRSRALLDFLDKRKIHFPAGYGNAIPQSFSLQPTEISQQLKRNAYIYICSLGQCLIVYISFIDGVAQNMPFQAPSHLYRTPSPINSFSRTSSCTHVKTRN